MGTRFSLLEEERKYLSEVVSRWVLEPIPIQLTGGRESAVQWFAENADEDVRQAITGLQYLLLRSRFRDRSAGRIVRENARVELDGNAGATPFGGIDEVVAKSGQKICVQVLRTGLASDDPETAKIGCCVAVLA